MKLDPAIVQIHAENVRAEIIPRATRLRLDPAIIQKIKQQVPIFKELTPDCLMRTLGVAEYFLIIEFIEVLSSRCDAELRGARKYQSLVKKSVRLGHQLGV
jgi:hypothetical protein